MDLITKSPGLQYVAETIFIHLDRQSLEECQKVNEHWKMIITNPWFRIIYYRQHGLLSPKHLNEWTKVLERIGDPGIMILRVNI